MTRTTPHPRFLPGDKVTLEHHITGTTRLIVSHTEPAIAGSIPWVVCTNPNGGGRYRRLATSYARGRGN